MITSYVINLSNIFTCILKAHDSLKPQQNLQSFFLNATYHKKIIVPKIPLGEGGGRVYSQLKV